MNVLRPRGSAWIQAGDRAATPASGCRGAHRLRRAYCSENGEVSASWWSSAYPIFGYSRRSRRGVATLWLIVSLPVLLLLVCFIVEIGNIWLARVELENALESAALAAVKEWADAAGGDTQQARFVGMEYAAANTVTGTPVTLAHNYISGNTNQNASCEGDLVFGALTNDVIPWVFNAGIQPSCIPGGDPFAVRAQASVTVNSICGTLLGVAMPVFRVSATATARDDCTAVGASLIRVRPENFICPGP